MTPLHSYRVHAYQSMPTQQAFNIERIKFTHFLWKLTRKQSKKLHTLININLLIPKSPHPPHIYTIRKLPLKKTAKAPETESEAPPLYQNKRWIINPYSPHCIQTTHHCSRHTPVVRLHCQHANAHCNANLLHQHTEFPSPYHLFHQIPSHRNW